MSYLNYPAWSEKYWCTCFALSPGKHAASAFAMRGRLPSPSLCSTRCSQLCNWPFAVLLQVHANIKIVKKYSRGQSWLASYTPGQWCITSTLSLPCNMHGGSQPTTSTQFTASTVLILVNLWVAGARKSTASDLTLTTNASFTVHALPTLYNNNNNKNRKH